MKNIIVPVVLAALLIPLPCSAENPKIKNDANGHFYQKFFEKKSWTNARASCEQMGGYLVTVTSEEERLFLMNHFLKGSRRSFWAGATDLETEGQWKWITGEPFNFADWAEGEPNNENDEDYLELPPYFNYQWNDTPDAVKSNCYICEWQNQSEPITGSAKAEPKILKTPAKNGAASDSNDSLTDFLETLASQGTESAASENQLENSAPLDSQPDNLSMGPHTYYIPLFEYSANFLTGLGLSNSSVTEEANIMIRVFDSEGGEVMGESANILPDGQQTIVLYPDKSSRGWILVGSDQPLTGVCFMIASGAGTDNFMADIPLFREKHRNLHVPHISYDDAWDTTFYVANPNANAQTVYIDVVGSNGIPIVSEKDEIASNGCGQYSLSSLLGRRELVGGKVKIYGADGVTAYALYTNIKTGARSFAGISPMEPF